MVRTRYADPGYKLPSSQRAAWCFTICNYTDADLAAVTSEQNYTALVYQFEVCPDTGTPHIQGYVELSRSARAGNVCRLLGGRASVYVRLGSQTDAVTYVTKRETRASGESGPFRLGCLKQDSPESSDAFTSFRMALESQESMPIIAATHFPLMMKYRNSAIWYRNLTPRKRDWEVTVTVLYGDTGSGKTRKARELLPNAYWLSPPNVRRGPIWFTDYNGEEDIIIDDFYGEMRYPQLLRLLDRYQMQVHVHGGFVPFLGRRFVITSNIHPSNWYIQCDYAPLHRRLTDIVCMNNLVDPTSSSLAIKTFPA